MAVAHEPAALLRDPALRALLDAAGVWLWEADLVTETTLFQDGFWEQYGYEPRSMSETFDFLKAMHTTDSRAVAREWRRHLDGETDLYQSQWRLRTASGEWRWIRARGKVTERDASGRPLRLIGAYSDITDLKLAEQGLAASNAELDAVFRGSHDGIALIAPDLTLLRANEAAVALVERLTGFAAHEGIDIHRIPGFSGEQRVQGDIAAALEGTPVPDRTLSNPDETAWMEFSYAPACDPEGSILGVAVVLRDITERKRHEQARLNAMRLESMGVVAGGMAHDFNNLLSSIIANIDVAEPSISDRGAKVGLGEARGAAIRAAELVQQLLAFSGQREAKTQVVHLSEVAREMVRYAAKVPGNRVPIREYLPARLPEIRADATQLRQLVLNLLLNALEATREHGSAVTIRAWTVTNPAEVPQDGLLPPETASRYVALQVADDGDGMDAATRARMFDPFFTTKPGGHGLGLSTVLGAIRSHGGTLSVKSEPGHGTEITVFLPAT